MITVISFLLAILILVTVHEFGHFWVAHRLGVKVLRFSVGFGKPLLSRRNKIYDTEFVIAAIPLGGYVKMLDEREGEVAQEELHLAFNRKPLWVRAAVVSAGPLFNFLFAIMAYWLVAIVGTNDIRPVIGEVAKSSIAANGGLAVNDMILAVGANEVSGWGQAMTELVQAAMSGDEVRLKIRGVNGRVYSTDLPSGDFPQDPKKWLENLGLKPKAPDMLPVVDKIVLDSPAANSGLVRGDKVVGINGNLIKDWYDLVKIVKENPGNGLEFRILRNNGVEYKAVIVPDNIVVNGENIGRIGISPLISKNQEYLVLIKYDPFTAFTQAVQQTVNITWLTFKMIWKMLTGESPFSQNIGGPVSIAQFAGSSFHAGFVSFTSFLALISISLGVLNLLPIPLLDGGHLLFYLVEFVKGSPVSEDFEILFQKIGIVLIATLTIFAVYNDISRLVLN